MDLIDISVCTLLYSITVAENLAWSDENRYDFKLVYEWKQIEYKFESEDERTESINNGTFNVGKIQPIDAQYTYNAPKVRERIFVLVPRINKKGVPATIGVVTNETRDGNPIIDPYPSWSWHINPRLCNYHRMVSVYRVWADECNRLWVVDTGFIENECVCSPQILVFDLDTDELLYKYEIPDEQHRNKALFVTPIAEVEDRENECENTWLYVADCNAYSLLVYSLKQNTSWAIFDQSFNPDPKYSVYTIGGDTVKFDDGILAVALTPATDGDERKLRYHALSNNRESWVYIKDLKNQSNFEIPYSAPDLFHTYKGTRDQQSATEGIDRQGNVYFSLLNDVELAKWNPNTTYKMENFEIINHDKKRMQFPSGLKVLPNKKGDGESLWVFSGAVQRILAGTLNGNRTNFRLFVTEL